MGRNIKLQLENLQKEINRREASLEKLRKAKKDLEQELFQQRYGKLLNYMEQNNLDPDDVLAILMKN